ncbi:WG repeat-containing protein [Butyrivibrio sp. X503]|uniref:WG repeat-containing protein n=1 Tax=Butyrivibrio sp. X503 TaxID=2364878 RepID=UPI0011C21A9B|nr:WG repeat-containing protein [Butyrivibrio sp. X503]
MKSIFAKKWSLLIIAVLSALVTGLFCMYEGRDKFSEYYIGAADENSLLGNKKLNIPEIGTVSQSLRSYHTGAVSSLLGEMMYCHYDREPKNFVGEINGDLPIRFYNDAKGKYGYVDKNGKVIIKEEYVDADDFSDIGIAEVVRNNRDLYRARLINAKGDIITVVPESTDEIGYSLINYRIDDTDKVIFYSYKAENLNKTDISAEEYFYVITDYSGKVRVELTKEQVKSIGLRDEYLHGTIDNEYMKDLKKQCNFPED